MNIAEKLAREISRVTTIRCQYEEMRNSATTSPYAVAVNMAPAIGMMNAALEEAFKAAGSNDPVEVITAIKDLEGFTG